MEPSHRKANNAFGTLFLIGFLVWGAYALWDQADNHHFIPHNKVSTVIFKNWSTGEYKSCLSSNKVLEQETPELFCGNTAEDYAADRKSFEVRFYGKTYLDGEKQTASFLWNCKKEDGTDPSFTCNDVHFIPGDAPEPKPN